MSVEGSRIEDSRIKAPLPWRAHGVSRVLVSEREIASRVRTLAAEIVATVPEGGEMLVVSVMTGALFFTADLVRAMPRRLRCGIVTVSSYGGTHTTSRGASLASALPEGAAGRHVLIVDDILDTGGTLRLLRTAMERQHPASVRTCVLLRKMRPEALATPCEFVGFDIPDVFVVGCGLDYDDLYRNMPFVGVLDQHAVRP
jgi:hypoxanthine phosphoribosyltransferase